MNTYAKPPGGRGPSPGLTKSAATHRAGEGSSVRHTGNTPVRGKLGHPGMPVVSQFDLRAVFVPSDPCVHRCSSKGDVFLPETGKVCEQTLRVTPAMEAGIADHVWSIELDSRVTDC